MFAGLDFLRGLGGTLFRNDALWSRRNFVCPRAPHLRRLLALEDALRGAPSCLLHHLESGRMIAHARRLEFLGRAWSGAGDE